MKKYTKLFVCFKCVNIHFNFVLLILRKIFLEVIISKKKQKNYNYFLTFILFIVVKNAKKKRKKMKNIITCFVKFYVFFTNHVIFSSFLFPPSIARCRQQLLATWFDCFLLVKKQSVTYLSHYLRNRQIDQLKCLKTEDRVEVVETLHEILNLLCTGPGMPSGDNKPEEMIVFESMVSKWKQQAAAIEGTGKGKR